MSKEPYINDRNRAADFLSLREATIAAKIYRSDQSELGSGPECSDVLCVRNRGCYDLHRLEQAGELSTGTELPRLFPGIADGARARGDGAGDSWVEADACRFAIAAVIW